MFNSGMDSSALLVHLCRYTLLMLRTFFFSFENCLELVDRDSKTCCLTVAGITLLIFKHGVSLHLPMVTEVSSEKYVGVQNDINATFLESFWDDVRSWPVILFDKGKLQHVLIWVHFHLLRVHSKKKQRWLWSIHLKVCFVTDFYDNSFTAQFSDSLVSF